MVEDMARAAVLLSGIDGGEHERQEKQ